MRKVLMSAAAALCLVAGQAGATTQHWRDTITYVKVAGGTSYSNCLKFQTTATNGVMGIDNTSGGDTGATGYTGTATWFLVGTATTYADKQYTSGAVFTLLENSRLSNGALTVSWEDEGSNTSTYYPDCPTNANAADNFGQ